MPASVWSGLITFGLVSIPVKLYSATESKGISFNQLHAPCKSRISQQRFCQTCNRQVEYSELEKGYEVAKGQYVVITKDELESLPLPSKQTVTMTAFVPKDDIDMVYHDVSYYVEPDPKAQRPFTLLMKTLTDKNVIGIGTIALRNKERLCALRPLGGTLMLDTLLYPDEVRVHKETALPNIDLAPAELAMAGSLIDLMAQPFNPSAYHDHYREALEKVIAAKANNLAVPEVEPESNAGGIPDLMEALRASVENMQTKKVVSLQSVGKTEEKAEGSADKGKKAPRKGRRAG
ncbi:MAG TPA: Ku protein [Oculatellaceae cyanobacterium]